MSDVLFITPSLGESFLQDSLGTLLLATILRKNGIQADVLRFADFGDPADLDSFINEAMVRIQTSRARIVSFYTRCDVYHIVLKMAQQLKQRLPVYIVFGGPQADIVAVETLQEFPCVDYICQGEGETTIVPFFSSLLNGAPDHSTPGLVYRHDGRILQNPKPAFISDLDMLPETDYSIVDTVDLQNGKQVFPIDVGRGCPFGCTYCSTKTFWGRKYRLKSPERIYQEVKKVHEQYGITYFAFEHDMFTLNRNKVLETCRLLKTLDFSIQWTCSARLDCLDTDMIDAMVDAGMKRIYIGIETGSARMQKLINKNLNLDSVLELLSYIHSKKILIITSFIYGFPEETEEDLSQTLALIAEIAKIDKTEIQTHLCTFLPGTELSSKYANQLTPASYFSNITGTVGLAECSDLVAEHPSVFSHFREYQTPLRMQLVHFETFIRTWTTMQPVYQFFAEQYPQDQLINLYHDFVRANQEILLRIKDLDPFEQVGILLKEDRLPEHLNTGDYYEIIKDCYRMASVSDSIKTGHANSHSDVYSFSPALFKRGSCLQDYEKQLTMVTYVKNEDGRIQTIIRSMK